MRATILAASGALLTACAANNFASLEGAGKAFPRAQYQVLGKTKYDQTWIDKTTEAEVVGFGFKRPLRRPASFDAASHTVVVTPAKPATITQAAVPPVVTVVKKKHWWDRFKRKK